MALQQQVMPLVFEGLDTKTDPIRGIATKLDLLENAWIQNPTKFRLRNGFTSLSRNIDGGGTITAGKKIAVYKDELLVGDGITLYSWDSVISKWTNRAKCRSAWATLETLTGDRVSTGRLNVTGAYASGVFLYAWKDLGGGGVTYRSYDANTGSLLLESTISTATVAKVLSLSNLLFLITIEGSVLKIRKLDPATPSTMGAATTIETATVTDFDVAADTGTPQIMVALYKSTITNTVTVRTVTTALAVSAATNFTQTGGNVVQTLGWLTHTWDNGKGYLGVTWNGAGVGVYVYDISTSTRAMSNATSVEIAIVTGQNLAGYFAGTTRTVFYEVPGASADKNYIRAWADGASNFDLARGCGLASKVFAVGSRYYLAAYYESTTQRQMFLIEYEDATVGANGGTYFCGLLQDAGRGGGQQTTKNQINDPAKVAADDFVLPWHYSFDLGSNYGVMAPRVRFNESRLSPPVGFADCLFVPGADLKLYDGVELVEAGYYVWPEAPTLASAAGGSKVNGGTYKVRVVYRWTDARGRIWRSPPGPSTTIVLGNTAISVTAATLRTTCKDPRFNKNANITKITIEIYCTANGGTTYYLDSTITNDVTADTVGQTLTQSDANLQTQELLYTTGGILKNEVPPAARLLRAVGTRLWVIAGNAELWFSKGLGKSDGPAWSSTNFQMALDESDGYVTCLTDLDDQVIACKRRGLIIIAGGNPDNAGGGTLFPDPLRRSTTVGASLPYSVRFPGGAMVQTARGLYAITLGRDVQYIGAGVERLALVDTITGADVADGYSQVRWTTSDGDLLVYDYVLNQWYVWTGLAAVGCATWQNTFCILTSNGTVKQESVGTFNDDGTAITMKLRTGWIYPGGIGADATISALHVLGEYKGAHTLQVQFSYNLSTYINETLSKNAAVAYNDSPYHGYWWAAKPKLQRCGAVQLTISNVMSGSGSEGAYWSALALEFSVDRGLVDLDLAKQLA